MSTTCVTATLFANDGKIAEVKVHAEAPRVRELLDKHAPAGYTYMRTLELGTKLAHVPEHAARVGVTSDHITDVVDHLRSALIPLPPTHELCIVMVRASNEHVEALAFTGATIPPTPAVSVDTQLGPRTNPRRKCASWSAVRRPIEIARRDGCTETLLVDDSGLVYEGTVSNVFFVADECALVTAPEDVVLPGTMRGAVIDACQRCNIDVIFECVPLDDIESYRAAFITSAARIPHPIDVIWRGQKQFKFPGSATLIDRLRGEVKEILRSEAVTLNDLPK